MELRTRRPVDLVVAVAISVAGLLLVLTDPTPLRVTVGIAAVLVAPGFVTVAALFPGGQHSESGGKSISPLERLALSLGLGLVVVPAVGLAVNFTPWGLRAFPLALGLTTFTATVAAYAHQRRDALPHEHRPVFRVAWRLGWRSFRPVDWALVMVLVLVLPLAVGAAAYSVMTPRAPPPFTELYLLGPDGSAEEYPETIAAGDPAIVIVGAWNHERRPVEYRVQVAAVPLEPGAEANASAPLVLDEFEWVLDDGERREQLRWFSLDELGRHRLEVSLWRDGDESAYRTVHLYVTVVETLGPESEDDGATRRPMLEEA